MGMSVASSTDLNRRRLEEGRDDTRVQAGALAWLRAWGEQRLERQITEESSQPCSYPDGSSLGRPVSQGYFLAGNGRRPFPFWPIFRGRRPRKKVDSV